MTRRFAVAIGLGCLVVLAVAAQYEWQRLNDPVRRLSGFIALPAEVPACVPADADCRSGVVGNN